MRGDRYSQMVMWLKVALPLIALGILSTLFLVSRAVDTPTAIPFADTEVQERLTNQQVTGPFFSGMSANGDEISFVAETLTTPNGRTGANRAETVDVRVDYANGLQLLVTADWADIDVGKDTSELTGDVVVTASNGYVIRSDLLNMRMTQMEMTSPDRITATTPVGDLEAGAMHLTTPDGAAGSQLLFTGGVKLLYQSQPSKE